MHLTELQLSQRPASSPTLPLRLLLCSQWRKTDTSRAWFMSSVPGEIKHSLEVLASLFLRWPTSPELIANLPTPSVKWDHSHPGCLRLYLITKKKTGHTPGFWLQICNPPGLRLVFISAEIRAKAWKEEAASCAPGSEPDQEPGCSLWQPLNKISNGSLQLYNLSLLEVCLLSMVQCCRENPEAPRNEPVQKQGSCLDPALCISFSSQLISYFNSAHCPCYAGCTQFKDSLVISSFWI